MESDKLIQNLQFQKHHSKERIEEIKTIKKRVSVMHDNVQEQRRKTLGCATKTEDMAYSIRTAHRNYLKMLDEHTESREYR